MTFAVLVIGGITRLTQSGLSMVDWQPIMGVIPPLTDAQWQETFDRYRQFPEYQVLRRGMSLDEFKFIFFWEYLHRMVARTIGLVFLVPFVFFWAKGWFTRPLAARALILFGLGAMQGVMGWFMVMSGLVDRPSVSHYRLAAHLSLAFIIFGYALWLARDLAIRAGARAGGRTEWQRPPGRAASCSAASPSSA
jgi:heme a synthase